MPDLADVGRVFHPNVLKRPLHYFAVFLVDDDVLEWAEVVVCKSVVHHRLVHRNIVRRDGLVVTKVHFAVVHLADKDQSEGPVPNAVNVVSQHHFIFFSIAKILAIR